jgi:hypothetical protein
MVIMALLPKASSLTAPTSAAGARESEASSETLPLAIATPETLPEAIAGRPYAVALAARGGQGALQWSLDGPLPEGLEFDPARGLLRGTPKAGTPKPAELVLHVSDGSERASRPTRLLVYQPDRPLTTPAWWKPGLPPIPWRAWLEQGFGFLILWLVHLVGMNAVTGLQRWSLARMEADPPSTDDDKADLRRRFAAYRWLIRLASLSAAAALAAWLWRPRT